MKLNPTRSMGGIRGADLIETKDMVSRIIELVMVDLARRQSHIKWQLHI